MKRTYGFIKGDLDNRDICYFPRLKLDTYPSVFNLMNICSYIFQQLNIGSCVSNASCLAMMYALQRQNDPNWIPSRLFLYYVTRMLENTTSEDSGCQVRDAVKALAKFGVCSEISDPYVTEKFAIKPSDDCFAEALSHQIIKYESVSQTIDGIKSSIFNGYPVIFGMNVYSSFESEEVGRTGMVSVPKVGEKLLGGHSMLLCGFDDAIGCFICANSWGVEWGDSGYCKIPYRYILSKEASDFWNISLVEDKNNPDVIVKRPFHWWDIFSW